MLRVIMNYKKNAGVHIEKLMWHYPILLLGMPVLMVLALAGGTAAIMYPISVLLGWV